MMQTAIPSCWMIIPGNSLALDSSKWNHSLIHDSWIGMDQVSRSFLIKFRNYNRFLVCFSAAFPSQSTKFLVRCTKKTLRVSNPRKSFWKIQTSFSCTSSLKLRSSDTKSSSSVFLVWGGGNQKERRWEQSVNFYMLWGCFSQNLCDSHQIHSFIILTPFQNLFI